MNVRIAYTATEGPTLVGIDGPIVVIDALRMSATVIVACAQGMEVVPVATVQEALAWKQRGALTAGERGGMKIPELDVGNSPHTLLHLNGANHQLLALTTSNGVPALLAVAMHPDVFIGSPLNVSTLVAHLDRLSPRELGILIAGRRGAEAAEDEMTAALLLARLGAKVPDALPAPTTEPHLGDYFATTSSGRKLTALGYAADVALCSQVDVYPIVPHVVAAKPHVRIRALEVVNV